MNIVKGMDRAALVIVIIAMVIVLSIANALYGQVHISLEKYFIKEGKFYVLLSEPQRIVTPFESSIGKVTTYSYQTYIPAFDIFYGAQYTDWREHHKNLSWKVTTNDMLRDSINGLKYTWKARLKTNINLTYQKNISYKLYPGKEVAFNFYSNELKYLIKVKVYIIDQQEYLLLNIFPEKFIGLTKYKTFLNSFELK